MIKKVCFKKLVKERCDDIIMKYLLKENEYKSKSKSKNIKYFQLTVQPYLYSNKITTRQSFKDFIHIPPKTICCPTVSNFAKLRPNLSSG